MARFSSNPNDDCGRGVVREVKEMVKALHEAGIEVIANMVLSHSAEGNEQGPTISFRGLDNQVYYMVRGERENKPAAGRFEQHDCLFCTTGCLLCVFAPPPRQNSGTQLDVAHRVIVSLSLYSAQLNPDGSYVNLSGCGNALNSDHPVVRQFIIDTLRYWVRRYPVASPLKELLECSPDAGYPQDRLLLSFMPKPELCASLLLSLTHSHIYENKSIIIGVLLPIPQGDGV